MDFLTRSHAHVEAAAWILVNIYYLCEPFPDPDIHSSALYSSSAEAKWHTPCLSSIIVAPEISSQSAREFSAEGQMVEGHQQRKLCLKAAIVVVCLTAVRPADQQRAVASFQSASVTLKADVPSFYLSDNS